MNNEQIEDWLCGLHDSLNSSSEQQKLNGYADEQQKWNQLLQQLTPQTNVLLDYFVANIDSTRLSEPLITQLLSLYYRFGVARCFVFQLVPTFIHSYLKARTKRWFAPSKMLEMFFLAIYNEEILAAGPGTPSMAKRADEIRLPSLRKQVGSSQSRISKLAADPMLLANQIPQMQLISHGSAIKIPTQQTAVESAQLGIVRPTQGSQARLAVVTTTQTASTSGGASSSGGTLNKPLRTSVRIGPYPAIDKIIAENRFMVLTRLLHSVNQLLPSMALDVVCRAFCHSMLYICRSGFSFNESNFRQRALQERASNEVFTDFSRKSRIHGISSAFLIEAINGLTFALFNGHADIALRALDAIHQRAQFELMADVLLETNALRYALSDPRVMQTILADHDTTTNSSQTPVNGQQQQQQTHNEAAGMRATVVEIQNKHSVNNGGATSGGNVVIGGNNRQSNTAKLK